VHGAQAGLQVYSFYELQSAALHAARPGSAACYVPLLKHGDVGVAVRRHAVCQCTGELKRDACYIALEVVWRSAMAALVYSKEYSTLWAACALEAPPLFERGEHLFSAGAGQSKAARAAQGCKQAHQVQVILPEEEAQELKALVLSLTKSSLALELYSSAESSGPAPCATVQQSASHVRNSSHFGLTTRSKRHRIACLPQCRCWLQNLNCTSLHPYAPLKASLQCVRLQSTPRPSKFADVPIMAVAYTFVQRVPTSQQCSQQCVLRNAALRP